MNKFQIEVKNIAVKWNFWFYWRKVLIIVFKCLISKCQIYCHFEQRRSINVDISAPKITMNFAFIQAFMNKKTLDGIKTMKPLTKQLYWYNFDLSLISSRSEQKKEIHTSKWNLLIIYFLIKLKLAYLFPIAFYM